MVDVSITEEVLADGKVRYSLGEPNWSARQIPDIRRPGSTVRIAEDRMIDVVILGDGFTDRATFRQALDDWLVAFYGLAVYETFAGCLRIRALFTPSNEAASSDRGSYYRCLMEASGEKVADGEWPFSGSPEDVAFREAIFRSLDLFPDVNTRRYPTSLDIGDSNQALTNAGIRDLYRNLSIALLVRGAARPATMPPSVDLHPSGRVIDIHRAAPDDAIHVSVAVGATELHEFCHALGQLADEYIKDRDLDPYERTQPQPTSVFSLSNLCFDDTTDKVPWLHLSPAGRWGRTASGQDPSPLVGWLWVGGFRVGGVWHAEYNCLMNGGHENFAFTQNAANDPTVDSKGNVKGADLRDDPLRLCLWCQEVVTIRLLEKTDQLLEDGDPSDITSQGTLWYDRWCADLRTNYFTLFDVGNQLTDAEARYAAMVPGPNGEPLWQSDLYAIPRQGLAPETSPVPALADDELFLLTGYAALP